MSQVVQRNDVAKNDTIFIVKVRSYSIIPLLLLFFSKTVILKNFVFINLIKSKACLSFEYLQPLNASEKRTV